MKKTIFILINMIFIYSFAYAADVFNSVELVYEEGRQTPIFESFEVLTSERGTTPISTRKVMSYTLSEFKSNDYSSNNNGENNSNTLVTATQDNKEPMLFTEAWARPLYSAANSAVYLKIKNNSNINYTLIGASAMSIANTVEIHQSYVDEKGVSRMTSVDKILIPGQTEVDLKPGGMHIMLFDLKRDLKAGDKFKIDLSFETLGIKTIDVEVKDDQN